MYYRNMLVEINCFANLNSIEFIICILPYTNYQFNNFTHCKYCVKSVLNNLNVL